MPTIADLYLAFRQAKIALYFERRGVGLLEIATYEQDLPKNLKTPQSKLAKGKWFDRRPLVRGSLERVGRVLVRAIASGSSEGGLGAFAVTLPPVHPSARLRAARASRASSRAERGFVVGAHRRSNTTRFISGLTMILASLVGA
jgi:hypothetical protein